MDEVLAESTARLIETAIMTALHGDLLIAFSVLGAGIMVYVGLIRLAEAVRALKDQPWIKP